MKENYCICGQFVANEIERNEHILSHFNQKHCIGCDKQLIFIAGRWYQPHIDIDCNVVKQEPEYDDNENCDAINNFEHNVKDESTEVSNIPHVLDPLSGLDPLAQSIEPESDFLDTHPVYVERKERMREADKSIDKRRKLVDEISEPENLSNENLEDDEDYTPMRSRPKARKGSRATSKNVRKWPCGFCAYKAAARYNVYRHRRIAHKIDDKTLYWGTTKAPIRGSQAPKNLVKIWSCGFCSYKSAFRGNIYEHRRTIHDSDDKTMNWQYGEMSSTDTMNSEVDNREANSASNTPIDNRSGEAKMWFCALCSKETQFIQNMYRHIRDVHKLDDKTLAVSALADEFVVEGNDSAQGFVDESENTNCEQVIVDVDQNEGEMTNFVGIIDGNTPSGAQTAENTLAIPVIDVEENDLLQLLDESNDHELHGNSHDEDYTDDDNSDSNHKSRSTTKSNKKETCERNSLISRKMGNKATKGSHATKKIWSCGYCPYKSAFKYNIYKHRRNMHDSDDQTLTKPVLVIAEVERDDSEDSNKPKLADGCQLADLPNGAGSQTESPCSSKSSESAEKDNLKTSKSAEISKSATKKWSCALCSWKTAFMSNIYRHIRDVHKLNDKTLAKRVFVRSKVITKRSNANAKKWCCGYCPYRSAFRYNIYKHRRNKHNTDDQTPVLDKEWIKENPGENSNLSEIPEGSESFELAGGGELSTAENIDGKRSNSLKSADKKSVSAKKSNIMKKWSCGHCPYRSNFRYNIYKHRRDKHGSNDQTLENSSLETPKLPRRTKLSTQKAANNVAVFSCRLCSRKTKSRSNMYRHIRSIHHVNDKTLAMQERSSNDSIGFESNNEVDRFECKLCLKRFPNRFRLERHMKVRHKIDPNTSNECKIACKYCAESFDDKRLLDIHKRAIHMERLNEDKIIKCAECPALFEYYYMRRMHLIQEHNASRKFYGPQFQCMFCEKKAKMPKALIEHLQTHDPSDNYKCCIESCDEQLQNLDDLYAHLKNHKRECDKCKRTFTEWTFHIHKCARPVFICDYCGKQFSVLYSFQVHMNRHRGTKLYKCLYCASTFCNSGARLKHQRTHTGERPCKCNVENCDRAFVQHTDLYRHQFKAHGIFRKKFACTVCEEVFPENSMLRKHLLTHSISLA